MFGLGLETTWELLVVLAWVWKSMLLSGKWTISNSAPSPRWLYRVMCSSHGQVDLVVV